MDTNSPGQEQTEENLARYDRLDFEAWNNQDWDPFHQLHTEQVIISGFGQTTRGSRSTSPGQRTSPRSSRI
jgi:hypothetical protein